MQKGVTEVKERLTTEGGSMKKDDTREQMMKKLDYFSKHMNETQLRLLVAFASGIMKKG